MDGWMDGCVCIYIYNWLNDCLTTPQHKSKLASGCQTQVIYNWFYSCVLFCFVFQWHAREGQELQPGWQAEESAWPHCQKQAVLLPQRPGGGGGVPLQAPRPQGQWGVGRQTRPRSVPRIFHKYHGQLIVDGGSVWAAGDRGQLIVDGGSVWAAGVTAVSW